MPLTKAADVKIRASTMNNRTVTELKCKTFELRFGGFEGLPAVKGRDWTDLAQFTCFGHQWSLDVWPGGDVTSDDGNMAVFLRNCSPGTIEVQATFAVAQSKAKVAAYYAMDAKKYQAAGVYESNWGAPNFAKRATMIGALQDGALVLDVQLKQTGPSSLLTPFVPENPSGRNTLKKFLDEETADVVFVVSKDQVKDGRKTRSEKNAPTTFHAHRFVLPESGALAEACESSNDLTPIPIAGTSPEIFRHLLSYLYGGKIYDKALKDHAKDIIDAADKFGIVGLKLEAEAAFVSSTTIAIGNVMENLHYADAKNCPLLKEAAIEFLVENGEDAVKKLSFQDFPGHVVSDVLTAVNRGKEEDTASSESSDLNIARVSALRKMLHEKGLGVDGSRETLIARLKAYRPPPFSFGALDENSSD